MQVNLWIPSQKVVGWSGLMGGEVVGNHVDLFAARRELICDCLD